MICAIAAVSGEIILRADLSALGSASQVGRVLRKVVAAGQLVRLGYGTYAKAQPSPLSGKPIPRQPLEALAWEAMERLGVEVSLGKAMADYAAGRNHQIPMRTSLHTAGRCISRQLRLGLRTVTYTHDGR